jgi:hypothetical protein
MKWKSDEQQQFMQQLQDQSQASQDLARALRVARRYDEADRVWAATQKLDVEIDILLGREMDNWQSSAEIALKELHEAKDKFDLAVKNIKNTVQVAQNVVDAVGWIDKIASIAGSLLPIL